MTNLTHRSKQEEIMDDLDSSGEVIHQTLRELETINTLLGGNYVTINGLDKLLRTTTTKKLTIVDLGCGGGDMLKRIAKWANKQKLNVRLIGIDANPHVIEFAKQNTSGYTNISYQTLNIFSEEFKQVHADIFLATLFMHHFTSDQLVSLFRQLSRQATLGLVINDLHRHWFAYHSIKWLTHFFSRSTMVKHDAALSVARSFRKEELKALCIRANCIHASIRWMWAFRWQIVLKKIGVTE